MSTENIKNILTILFDELTSGIYCIVKSAKEIKRSDLEEKLKEKGYNYKDLNYNLGVLMRYDFIEKSQQIINNEPIEGIRKYQKPTQIELIKIKNQSIMQLKNPYEKMKKNLFFDLESREKKRFLCLKCRKEELNEYDASMNKFKCRNCGSYLENISEKNVGELRRKCNEILDVLDNLFKEEEKNSKTGINYYYNTYLTSKFGKNYFKSNATDVFEEDHDNYICKTLDNLDAKDKMIFYELVEGFIRAKKK